MGEIGEEDKEVHASKHKTTHGDEKYSTGNIGNNIVITVW